MSDSSTPASSTKQLKRVLGFGDLMGVAFGHIIGAGIMTLLGSAIAMTGRSVPLAFLISAVITIFQTLPMIITAGTVRLRGGTYTIIATLCGKELAGAYVILTIFQSMSTALFTLSFGSYFCSFFGLSSGYSKYIGFAVLTLFYVINLRGVAKFAKAQNLISFTLIFSLALFACFGLFRIQPGYFSSEPFLPGGVLGLLQTAGVLTFAMGGGAAVVTLSAEAKNPTRDIPIIAILSTIIVAVLYAVVGFVAAGVLPIAEVANQNLTVVAAAILPKPLYLFFVACGAGLAMLSPINNAMTSYPRPMLQMCDDGWLPRELARLNKNGSPYILQTILYVLTALSTFSGIDVSSLASFTIVMSGAITTYMNLCVMRLPTVCSEAWEVSKFKLSRPLLMLAAFFGAGASATNVFLNARNLSPLLLGVNVAVITAALLFGLIRGKKIEMEVSYENE